MFRFLASFAPEATQGWVERLLVFLFWAGVLWLVRRMVLRGLERITARTESTLDDELLGALRGPSKLWVLLGAAIPALTKLKTGAIPEALWDALSVLFLVLFLLSLVAALSNLTLLILRHVQRKAGSSDEITTLTEILVRGFWMLPALLALLNRFDFDVKPYVAGLGVGGIVAGLALKDTLANLFAGFYVGAGGDFHKGDFVRLSSGEEGYVTDIKWRLTTLRTLAGHMILIPNSKMVDAIVTNFTHPQKRVVVRCEVPAAYETDVGRLERVVIEEVHALASEMETVLLDPEPALRFNPGFGDSQLTFTLFFWVTDYEQQFAALSAIRRRLLERFRKEGIEIPYPRRVMEIRREGTEGGTTEGA